MLQYYFTHKGVKYNAGSLISFRVFDYRAQGSYITKVTFLYYDTDEQKYFVDINGKECSYSENLFFSNLQDTENKYEKNNNMPTTTHTFSDELNIDCLLIAWIWYVFIMVVGVIFYERIGIWILASIIFFNYRNKILKEVGYK